jgi:4-hydroxybutyrate CoA-transferase
MREDWKTRFASQVTDSDTAMQHVKDGDHLYMSGNCSVPRLLLDALVRRAPSVRDLVLHHVLSEAPAHYVDPEMEGHLRVNTMFISKNVRSAVNEGRADMTPVFLSEVPQLFERGLIPLDVLLIQVSPPDARGFISLGIEGGLVKAATSVAKIILGEVNEQMPRILGDCFLHVSQFHQLIPANYEVSQMAMAQPNEISVRIASHIAPLIEDGSTIQAGIGGIPNAVLNALHDKKDLGVHSELIADGMVALAEAGVITNARKTLHCGKMIAGFMIGSRKVYDFADDNPMLELRPTEYVNDPFIIAQNNKMVAINSAVEVDLTGQVCADSIGTRFYSGVGGQVDFIYGASRSKGGQAIIALPATATMRDGTLISKIVPMLKPGAGVTTTRNHVRTVVTEFGAAQLYGKCVRERARALIDIAHPQFREELTRLAFEAYRVSI